jgi:hypothetical protein
MIFMMILKNTLWQKPPLLLISLIPVSLYRFDEHILYTIVLYNICAYS